MDKTKIFKRRLLMLVAIFIFLCIPLGKWIAAQQIGAEGKKKQTEEQEKKMAKDAAEKYMNSFVAELESELSSTLLTDVKVSYSSMNYDEFIDAFGTRDTNPDYEFYYRIVYSSNSIDQVYAEKKDSEKMSEFCDALTEMNQKKRETFSKYGFKHREWINNKSVMIYYVDNAIEYELPIIGASGSIYRDYDNSWENTRHLDIDDVTVYSEVKDERKENSDSQGNSASDKSNFTSGSGSHSWSSSDPYDVDDYDNADDFAEEWADEFGDGNYDDGYDDAYDYWESERD